MFITMNVGQGMRGRRAELVGVTGADTVALGREGRRQLFGTTGATNALVFNTMNVDHEQRGKRVELAGITEADTVAVGREGRRQLFNHRSLVLIIQGFLLTQE